METPGTVPPLPDVPVKRASRPGSGHALRTRRGAAFLSATVQGEMTAKEKLREQVEAFSEQEASEALRLLELHSDHVLAAFPEFRSR